MGSSTTILDWNPALPLSWGGFTHLFFSRPLKSSSPASSVFPSPLWPLRGGIAHPAEPCSLLRLALASSQKSQHQKCPPSQVCGFRVTHVRLKVSRSWPASSR